MFAIVLYLCIHSCVQLEDFINVITIPLVAISKPQWNVQYPGFWLNLLVTISVQLCRWCICRIYFKIYHIAGIAQLGERQTEDLKVACSIHAHRKLFTFYPLRFFNLCRSNFFLFFLTLCQCLLLRFSTQEFTASSCRSKFFLFLTLCQCLLLRFSTQEFTASFLFQLLWTRVFFLFSFLPPFFLFYFLPPKILTFTDLNYFFFFKPFVNDNTRNHRKFSFLAFVKPNLLFIFPFYHLSTQEFTISFLCFFYFTLCQQKINSSFLPFSTRINFSGKNSISFSPFLHLHQPKKKLSFFHPFSTGIYFWVKSISGP